MRSLLLLGAASAFLISCHSPPRDYCQAIFAAFEELQPLHLNASAELDKATLFQIQKSLLEEHRIAVPRDFSSKSSFEQCVTTFDLVRGTYPSSDLPGLAVDFANQYLHQEWDPHSTVISDQALANASRFSEGYGFSLGQSANNHDIEVTDVIASSSAFRGGIREGARLIAVNGRPTRGMPLEALFLALNEGNSVVLTLELPRGQKTLSLKREALHLGTFKLKVLPIRDPKARVSRQILYVKPRYLETALIDQLAETLRAFEDQQSALILDLRDIPFGRLEVAARLANLFIDQGTSFVGLLGRGRDFGDQPEQPVLLEPARAIWNGPLVVLVNAGTKSAAEILAGALQDYGAVVVGTRTYGKGTRQQVRSLQKFGLNAQVQLTDAYTIRPSGLPIQLRGIEPDILVELRPPFSSAYPDRREGSNFHPLPSPVSPNPAGTFDDLAGYEHAFGFKAWEHTKPWARLRSEIDSDGLVRLKSLSLDGLQLQAAKKVALFLTNHADGEAAREFTYDEGFSPRLPTPPADPELLLIREFDDGDETP